MVAQPTSCACYSFSRFRWRNSKRTSFKIGNVKVNPVSVLENLTEELRNKFRYVNSGYSVPDLVMDYINHGEAKIALELLIDQLYEFNILVSKPEFQSLLDPAQIYECEDRKSLAFIGVEV